MKKSMLIIAAVLAIALVNYSVALMPENPARAIVMKMVDAVNSSTGCTYTMKGEERLVNMKELRGGDIFTKLRAKPHAVYMKMVTDPNKGTEVLWAEGDRNNKALVNKGSFWPTFSLDPTGSLLTKDQHHTLLSAGFGMTARVISEAVKRADGQKRFDEVFKYAGDVTWNGRSCYKIVVFDPTWAITTYTAQKGETMASVAAKLLIPEYSLTELDGIKGFEGDLGGKTLKVPTSYAQKSVLYIDKENNFPVFQEMSDDKGVFERYSFYDVVVNPSFKPDEFSKGFAGYKF